MSTEKTNSITDVAQIVWWNRVDDNHYEARVTYRDGTQGRYDHLTKEDWLNVKAAELDAELEELNAPIAMARHREQDRQEEKIAQIQAGQLANYKNSPEHYGCCAWCKNYWNRHSGRRMAPTMTDEQFEATRHDGTSHGCCPQCKVEMMAKAKKTKKTFDAGTPVKVTNTADEFGDPRNVGRFGVVVSVITDFDEGQEALYEIEFTDGKKQDPHWMDIEAGLTNGNSVHFHGELERM